MAKKPRNTKPLKQTPIALPAPEPVLRPQLPPHAFTVTQWKANPALQKELQLILDQPVLKMAFQTLLLAALPGAAPAVELKPGISGETMAIADANRYHHRSGMSFLHRALHGLARGSKTASTAAPWGVLFPEDE